ncbi:MAG: Rhamnosyltransferase WbbL [Ignavibacteria bacterium]|nr:Rhamnosyltransferase WbbL [Ignavibacteria bacterium]
MEYMKEKTDILIQIINYNTKDYLDDCLSGLFEDIGNSEFNYKVIVLDNNSNDNLCDLKEKYADRKIEFIKSEKNHGFGGGHNYISRLADSRYNLILNSDIKFIEPDTVARLFKRIQNSGYKVIGPCLVLEDFSRQEFDHGELYGLLPRLKNSFGSSYWKPRSTESEAAWVSGAVFMIESDVFREMNGFDEKFFLYKEEEDLCKRILHAGYKILYYPEVSIMHIGHVVALRSEHFGNSMNYYLEKHFRNKLSFKILNVLKIIRDMLLHGEVKERK